MLESWLSAAHLYAEQGWHVLPVYGRGADGACRCGTPACPAAPTHPLPETGLAAAAHDAPTLEAWEQRWPGAELALLCGRASGAVVLEVRMHDGGGDTLAALVARHGALPATVASREGAGIRRYWFARGAAHVDGARALGRGVTLLGEGALAPLPTRLYGHARTPHRWEDAPGLAAPAPCPAWLAPPTVAPLPPVRADDGLFEDATSIAAWPACESAFLAGPWVAEGALTLVGASPLVGGKTTFLLDLLRAAASGGRFLGHEVASARALLLTDAAPPRLARSFRAARIDLNALGDRVSVLWGTSASQRTWDEVVDAVVGQCARHDARLVLVDALDGFVRACADVPSPAAVGAGLRRIADAGVAVVAAKCMRVRDVHLSDRLEHLGPLAAASDVTCWLELPADGRQDVRRLTATTRLGDQTPPCHLSLRDGALRRLPSAAQLSFDAAMRTAEAGRVARADPMRLAVG